MSLFKFLYDKLYFPFALGRNYPVNPYKICKNLLNSQYWSFKAIREYQDNRIDEVIKYAKNNIPYYAQIIENKYRYSLDDLKRIPITTKEILKKHPDTLYRTYSGKEYRHVTSGSSGDPLTVITDGFSEAHRIAQSLRFFKWWGIQPSHKNVLIWGETEENVKINNGIMKRLKKKIFRNTYFINVFSLNNDTIELFYHDLLKFKPHFIRGYKSAIYQFAFLLNKHQLDASRLNINLAITTSEVLLTEERNYIETTFNTKVADEYGAAEIGLFAYECPYGSKHICEESNYICTSKDNELLVTNLHNKSMPLINYKIGDSIEIDDQMCPCGRSSRVIKSINGRIENNIKKDNGEMLSPRLFSYIIKDLLNKDTGKSILKYKVIQKDMHFDFYIVKGNDFSEKVTDYLLKRMKRDIGYNITVEFHFVNEIPLDKSGKLQYFKRIK